MQPEQILALADKCFADRAANTLPTRTFMARDEEVLAFATAIMGFPDVAVAHKALANAGLALELVAADQMSSYCTEMQQQILAGRDAIRAVLIPNSVNLEG